MFYNQKWPTNHPIYYDHNNINEELQIMYEFIDKKHKKYKYGYGVSCNGASDGFIDVDHIHLIENHYI